ncbi:MAG: NHL repeat-containing protein [bacterium]|nr:MAG: NHL repeat-containing protein [bacterium]
MSDFSEGKVRRIDAVTNVITTIAGDGSLGDKITGDGGLATKAALGGPRDIAFDTQDNLFISTSEYVRRVDAKTNIITTIAGNGSNNNVKDGELATKGAIGPESITIDNKGNVLVVDGATEVGGKLRGALVRRIDTSGVITSVVGNGQTFFSGEGSLATNTGLGLVRSIEIDSGGNLFISAAEIDPVNFIGFLNPRILRVDASSKTINTFIKGNNGYQGDGGSLANASIVGIPVISFSPNGDLLLLDIKQPIAALRLVHLQKTSGGPISTNISISNAAYLKPNLAIDGQGFGSSGAKVVVNGTDASAFISNNTDTKLTLSGSRKKLNMRKGTNQLTVTSSTGATASFQFNF